MPARLKKKERANKKSKSKLNQLFELFDAPTKDKDFEIDLLMEHSTWTGRKGQSGSRTRLGA